LSACLTCPGARGEQAANNENQTEPGRAYDGAAVASEVVAG
jgi:hypothetical protein